MIPQKPRIKKTPSQVVKEIIEKADVILEVLDARMPEVTRDKQLEERIKKPLIIVINKSDLLTKRAYIRLKEKYRGYVIVSSKKRRGIGNLIRIIKSKTKYKRPWVAVVGYPNTGKSFLINRLSKGGRARTSSVSGFTKGLQLIAGKMGFRLFDTPGIIPVGEKDEIRLGLISCLSPEKLEDPELVAYELIKLLKSNNPEAIRHVYGINPDLKPEKIILELGKKRHMLKKGGKIDEKRAAIHLLVDWHKGKIRI